MEADATFREQFPNLVEQLRSELPSRQSVDACAEVDLRATAAGILVKVSLPDGRETMRDVARAEDVRPTLHALLLVPEQRTKTATPTSAPTPALAPRPPSVPPAPHRTAAAAPVAAASRDVGETSLTRSSENGFELSVVSGARVGDGQYGYGAGVLSFVKINRWLIGFQGRADGYRALSGSDPETALALGLLLGRRFDLHDYALDLTAGPALTMRGASFGDTQAVSVQASPSQALGAAMATPPPERDVGPVPRLLLAARLGFSPRSLFRTFIGIDGELGPSRSADASQDFGSSGRMPAYTIGLSLGATVGTR